MAQNGFQPFEEKKPIPSHPTYSPPRQVLTSNHLSISCLPPLKNSWVSAVTAVRRDHSPVRNFCHSWEALYILSSGAPGVALSNSTLRFYPTTTPATWSEYPPSLCWAFVWEERLDRRGKCRSRFPCRQMCVPWWIGRKGECSPTQSGAPPSTSLKAPPPPPPLHAGFLWNH